MTCPTCSVNYGENEGNHFPGSFIRWKAIKNPLEGSDWSDHLFWHIEIYVPAGSVKGNNMYFVQTFIPITFAGNKAAYILTQLFEKGYLFQLGDKSV